MEKNNFVYCFQTDAGVVMNKRSEQQILNIMSDMGITEELCLIKCFFHRREMEQQR